MNMCPRGVTVSTLDSESSDRGSNPREGLIRTKETDCVTDGVRGVDEKYMCAVLEDVRHDGILVSEGLEIFSLQD